MYFVVINLSGFMLFNSNTEYNKTIFLLLENNHYRHVSFEGMKIKKKCTECGKLIFFDDDEHECDITHI